MVQRIPEEGRERQSWGVSWMKMVSFSFPPLSLSFLACPESRVQPLVPSNNSTHTHTHTHACTHTLSDEDSPTRVRSGSIPSCHKAVRGRGRGGKVSASATVTARPRRKAQKELDSEYIHGFIYQRGKK